MQASNSTFEAVQLLQVSRYYSFFIVNMVAPIILTTMLGFFVFLLGVEDMEKRLGEPSGRVRVLCFRLRWRCGACTTLLLVGSSAGARSGH